MSDIQNISAYQKKKILATLQVSKSKRIKEIVRQKGQNVGTFYLSRQEYKSSIFWLSFEVAYIHKITIKQKIIIKVFQWKMKLHQAVQSDFFFITCF